MRKPAIAALMVSDKSALRIVARDQRRVEFTGQELAHFVTKCMLLGA
jgi:hypothetical protein